MISHHPFFLNFKTEQLPFDVSSSSAATKKTYEALDLSRRRDSVETRKTPSPYSSSFGENSPPLHDSPSTTSSMSLSHSRTGTPIHHYSSPLTSQFRQSPPDSTISHSYRPKRETPSPNDMIYKQLQQSCAISEAMTPYMLQAQRHTPTIESDESSETSSFNTNMNLYPMVVGRNGKLPRPFKAYPKDPLSMTGSFSAAVSTDSQSAEKHSTFRKHMLQQIHAVSGGQPTVSNPQIISTSSKTVDCENKTSMEDFLNDSFNNNNNSDWSNGGIKDSAYYERRKKNNAAAKKSRDRRRIKEDEIAIRAAILEKENIELKIQLAEVQKVLAMFSVNSSS